MSWRNHHRNVARWSRQIGALGLLVLSSRFAWLVTSEAFAGSAYGAKVARPDKAEPTVERRAKGLAKEFEEQTLGSRPDLDEIREMVGEPSAQSANKGPLELNNEEAGPVLRRLVVDYGPERAPVYVNGRRVGQVPYVGMVHCVDGEEVKVQVLPPKGVPLTRHPICGGEEASGVK